MTFRICGFDLTPFERHVPGRSLRYDIEISGLQLGLPQPPSTLTNGWEIVHVKLPGEVPTKHSYTVTLQQPTHQLLFDSRSDVKFELSPKPEGGCFITRIEVHSGRMDKFELDTQICPMVFKKVGEVEVGVERKGDGGKELDRVSVREVFDAAVCFCHFKCTKEWMRIVEKFGSVASA